MDVRWLFLFSGFTCSWATILYPRENELREVKSLDGLWDFRKAERPSEGISEKWFSDRLSKSGPTVLMPVPSSYNDITEDKSLREHVGVVWYDRTFFVPPRWKQTNQRVWLRFGSAHYSTRVWVNGEEAMHHEIGHLPFAAEVTDLLRFQGENRITVSVDNRLTPTTIPQGTVETIDTLNGPVAVQRYTFDFFNYAGIHRSVVLFTTPPVYVNDITTYTAVDGEDEAKFYFNVTYAGISAEKPSVLVTMTLYDAKGVPAAQTSKRDDTGSGFIGVLLVQKPHLWWPYLMDPDPGYLYTAEAKILTKVGNSVIEDKYTLPIGLRLISWTNTSLLINNRPVYLRGFGKHEDSDIRGKGLDYPLIVKDFNLMKWVGANAFRTSHYPYSEEIMDLADQYGIMVVDECPAVDIDNFSPELLRNHKKAIAELVQRDKNRASVIMWSIANEPRSQHPEAAEYFRSAVSYFKGLETQRPITAALNQWCSTDKAGQFLDIIGFNRYNAWYTEPGKLQVIQKNLEGEIDQWYATHGKPVIMMEYGADAMPGLHLDPSYVWSEEYQVELLSEHFKTFDKYRVKKYFIGEMIWNFADFKTDQATTRVGGNKKGIFTRSRQPKASAFHVRRRYLQLAQLLEKAAPPPDLYRYTSAIDPAIDRNEL